MFIDSAINLAIIIGTAAKQSKIWMPSQVVKVLVFWSWVLGLNLTMVDKEVTF